MIFVGNKEVKEIFIGTKPVKEIYKGTTKIWPKELTYYTLTVDMTGYGGREATIRWNNKAYNISDEVKLQVDGSVEILAGSSVTIDVSYYDYEYTISNNYWAEFNSDDSVTIFANPSPQHNLTVYFDFYQADKHRLDVNITYTDGTVHTQSCDLSKSTFEISNSVAPKNVSATVYWYEITGPDLNEYEISHSWDINIPTYDSHDVNTNIYNYSAYLTY